MERFALYKCNPLLLFLSSIKISRLLTYPSKITKYDKSLLEGTAFAPHQKEGGVANIAPMPGNSG